MRDLSSVNQEIDALWVNIEKLEKLVGDHAERFDTLQTRWWKRLWFRIDGWPGQMDLNAPNRRWRPWHKKVK